jgi:hypothetical protein
MAKTIELGFDGHYNEEHLPPQGHQCPGVYAVYRANDKGLVELLYIGRSSNAADRPSSSHHKYKDWRKALKQGERLYFSFADTSDEKQAEAALIYKLKPRLNDTGTEGFHYKQTTIKTFGKAAFLGGTFTVDPTDD